jgi:hypothetical protein
MLPCSADFEALLRSWRAAGDDPAARSAAARVPPHEEKEATAVARGLGVPLAKLQARVADCMNSTRCWASAAAASPSVTPRSLRCRRAPSSRRR